MAEEDKKELPESISALTGKVDSLSWAIAGLKDALEAILKEMQRQKSG